MHVLEDALLLEILDYISGYFNINLDIRLNMILILFLFNRYGSLCESGLRVKSKVF